MQVIVFNQANGVLAIVYPTPEALQTRTVQEVGFECVPQGLPFKVIDSSQLPTDRENRHTWSWPESDLTDGTGTRT